jgi:hypothetical protein
MDIERGSGDKARLAGQDAWQAMIDPHGVTPAGGWPAGAQDGRWGLTPDLPTVPLMPAAVGEAANGDSPPGAPNKADPPTTPGKSRGATKWDTAAKPPAVWPWLARLRRADGGPRLGRRTTAMIVLVCLLVIALSGALGAFLQYNQVRSEASDGVAHLKRVQTLLEPLMQHPGIPDAATLATVERELRAAEHDFAATRSDLGHGVFSIAASVPAGSHILDPVTTLAAAADEACLAGLDLMRAADTLLPLLHTDLLGGSPSPTGSPTPGPTPSPTPGVPSPTPTPSSASSAPTLTVAMMQAVTADYEDAVRHLQVAITDAGAADLSALPANLITTQQRAQLHALLTAWPRIAPQLVTVDAALRVAPELLGLSAPMRFLVELMDRGESRATGGYIGDYGVLTIQNAKVQPFSLVDIRTLDYPYMGAIGLQPPPPAYSWWPMPGFALRDSNLSPDFPTSARLGIKLLAAEGGGEAQGAIGLTAPVIARVLAVVGPVTVPEYNQVVTAENLEAEIRLNTENHDVLYNEKHEQFTAFLGQAFMSKLHSLSTSQLMAIAQAMLTSMHTKDLQVYLSDPAAETLLTQQGIDGAIAHGPGDGLTITDSNVSINKSNIFTTLIYTDVVTLGADGAATHHLTITYDFDSSTNPSMQRYLEGRHHYHTYLRVYAPPNAHLITFGGFNEGGEQINKSDEPGRQMWGGFVGVWDGTPYSLRFVWSVPGAGAKDAAGRQSYTLTVQHQAGANQRLNLSVTAPGTNSPVISYSGALDQDRGFSAALP